MCEGRPSMLMTVKGQMIADELSNSHASMAEKYLGDSRKEDECFQPELIISRGAISVNSRVSLKIKDVEITDKIGKNIVEYFNKTYNTVAKLRAAIDKTRRKRSNLFKSNWVETWRYFEQVLKDEVVSEINNMEDHKIAGTYGIITNDSREVKMLAKIKASKERKNLKSLWQKPIKFTLEHIEDKETGRKLFV